MCIKDFIARRPQNSEITIFKINKRIGYLAKGKRVGSRKGFTNANTQYQGAPLTRDDNLVFVLSIHHSNRISPLKLCNGLSDRVKQRCTGAHCPVNEVNNHFGVGLRAKFNALSNQGISKFCVVFDNTVMNQCHTITRKVGMCVSRGRLAMGGPTCMRNTAATHNGI